MERKCLQTAPISYLDSGHASDPLVVCLHGFPDVPITWEGLLAELPSKGYRVVAPYLRGYAPSILHGPYDPVSVAKDTISLIDELSPDRPASLVGHDWGAVVSYAALALAPNRFSASAILSIPHPRAILKNLWRYPAQAKRSAYIGLFQVPKLSQALVMRQNFAFIERLWRVWSRGFSPNPVHLAEVKSCLRESLPAPLGYYRALRDPEARMRTLSLLKNKLRVPTLYVHGESDGCMTARLSDGQEEFFDTAYERTLVTEAGHFVHLERPRVVIDAIERWFGRYTPTKGS